ncbi:MAG TPA: hypothetical protein VGN20_11840 [Mucilaginibacter sp.]|jgi:hypothetical protein
MQVSSIPEFQLFITRQGREEKDLHALISLPEGLEIWIKEGFSWDAEFDLAEGSVSWQILTDYFERKGSA